MNDKLVPWDMTITPAPRVFLSHSHLDKRVARRLLRRLSAHGIRVWLDERELRVGATLTSSIQSQVEESDVLLVIASQASADSQWVGLEMDFARKHGKTVIPFFIESLSLAKHELFQDILGVDAVSPQAFADVVHSLMRDLFLSHNLELPAASPGLLAEALRDVAREEPDLAPLILGCLDSEGLHQENMDTAYKAPFHPLDEALNALFDLKRNESIAFHAAYGFYKTGAGVRALSLWIDATGDGGTPLVIAVGTRLEPTLIPTAIKLLAACDPPNNQAIYNFIDHNSTQLDDTQRRSVIRLVTWPVRTDTSRLGDVLGWVAFKHFPDAAEIQQMWIRWVRAGEFDGKPQSPEDLARYLIDASKEGLPWEPIAEALRSHVRTYLRSKEQEKVFVAIDHIKAAADESAPVLASLLREANGVSGTAEWDDWRKRDPDTAKWMEWYVFEFAKEAAGDRNWLRALEGAKQMVAFEEERRQMFTKDEQGANGGE